MNDPRKNGAVVFAKNVDRLTAFYRDATSLAVTHREPGLVVLEGYGTQLVLHAIPPHIAPTRSRSPTRRSRARTRR